MVTIGIKSALFWFVVLACIITSNIVECFELNTNKSQENTQTQKQQQLSHSELLDSLSSKLAQSGG